MSNRCYYCSEIFESREELYDHVVIHARIRDENNQKTENNKQKNKYKLGIKEKKYQPKPKISSNKRKKNINILEKIEQFQEKIETDTI